MAIPHMIDDFLFGIPQEFSLSNIEVQIMAGIFSLLLMVIFSLVAMRHRWGYIAAAMLGFFLALAGILKHVPYWSGLFSEILNWALILSGISLLIVSISAAHQTLADRNR